jgi:hypothetical protein
MASPLDSLCPCDPHPFIHQQQMLQACNEGQSCSCFTVSELRAIPQAYNSFRKAQHSLARPSSADMPSPSSASTSNLFEGRRKQGHQFMTSGTCSTACAPFICALWLFLKPAAQYSFHSTAWGLNRIPVGHTSPLTPSEPQQLIPSISQVALLCEDRGSTLHWSHVKGLPTGAGKAAGREADG